MRPYFKLFVLMFFSLFATIAAAQTAGRVIGGSTLPANCQSGTRYMSIRGKIGVSPGLYICNEAGAWVRLNEVGGTTISGFATTATAAATTTLTVSSKQIQEFTGATTQTVILPVVSTLVAGQSFYVINNSSGAVTVNSSGANAVQVLASGTATKITCVLITGTTAASWDSAYIAPSVYLTGDQTVAGVKTFSSNLNVPTINGVKVYRALLTQTGTNAPVSTVLENSLGGTVVWARTIDGVYGATLVGAFTADKVWYNSGFSESGAGALLGAFTFLRINGDLIRLITTATGDLTTLADGQLLNTPVEIRVYP